MYGNNSVCTIYFPEYNEQYKAGVAFTSNIDLLKRKTMVALIKLMDIKLLIPVNANEYLV